MTSARQSFRNDSGADLFIYLEPWTWRYRLRPSDVFELICGVECHQPGWAPLEVNLFVEGDSTALQIFVNGSDEPQMRINGAEAEQDYNIS